MTDDPYQALVDWLIDFTWDAELDAEDVEDFTKAQFQNWNKFSEETRALLVEIVTVATQHSEDVDLSGWFS